MCIDLIYLFIQPNLQPQTQTQGRAVAVQTLEALASLTLPHLQDTWVNDPLLLVGGEQSALIKPVQVRCIEEAKRCC